MISSTKNYIASGIVAHINGLALLGRRSKNCHNLTGYWSMPCGMIDPGENPEQAARREFFEETGVHARSEILPLEDFEIEEGKYFALFSMKLNDLIFPSVDAIDAIEHEEWGFFKISKNTLPTPMTKETSHAILKLK